MTLLLVSPLLDDKNSYSYKVTELKTHILNTHGSVFLHNSRLNGFIINCSNDEFDLTY